MAIITEEERRQLVLNLEVGDVVTLLPQGGHLVYMVVLARSGLRVVMSRIAHKKADLVPIRYCRGDLEITDDGQLHFDDGVDTFLGSVVCGVEHHKALVVVGAYEKRLRPRESIIKRPLVVNADMQTADICRRIQSLVLNQDFGDSFPALFEAYIRLTGEMRSREESTLFLSVLFSSIEVLSVEREIFDQLKGLASFVSNNQEDVGGPDAVQEVLKKAMKH